MSGLSFFEWRFWLKFSLLCFLYSPVLHAQNKTSEGIASYYHDSLEGLKTASGEVFSQGKWTAAHKSLPLQTWTKVEDEEGNEIVVRINDRLPANSSRIIDLTTLAARQLDMVEAGLKKVTVRVISPLEAWMWFQKNSLWKPFYYYGIR